jgi:hypothetical protein
MIPIPMLSKHPAAGGKDPFASVISQHEAEVYTSIACAANSHSTLISLTNHELS